MHGYIENRITSNERVVMQPLDIEIYRKILKDKYNIPTKKIPYFIRWVLISIKKNRSPIIFQFPKTVPKQTACSSRTMEVVPTIKLFPFIFH